MLLVVARASPPNSEGKNEPDIDEMNAGTGLRRSRSLSAASLLDGGKQKSSSGLKDENGAAYSNLIGTSDQQCERSNR